MGQTPLIKVIIVSYLRTLLAWISQRAIDYMLFFTRNNIQVYISVLKGSKTEKNETGKEMKEKNYSG